MKISRSGSERTTKDKEIDLGKVIIQWNSPSKAVFVSAKKVRDFGGRARHDYLITISLDELAQLIEVVGDVGVKESGKELGSGLRNRVRAIHRLAAACLQD